MRTNQVQKINAFQLTEEDKLELRKFLDQHPNEPVLSWETSNKSKITLVRREGKRRLHYQVQGELLGQSKYSINENIIIEKVGNESLYINMDSTRLIAKLFDPTQRQNRAERDFKREYQNTKLVKHMNAKMPTKFTTESGQHGYYLFLARQPGVNLRNVLTNRIDQFSEIEKIILMRSILNSIKFQLHNRGMKLLHRDLKPENIMADITNLSRPIVNTIDFDISANLDDRLDVDVNFGTYRYMAPEAEHPVLGLSEKVDVFSLGLIFAEIMGASWQLPNQTIANHPFLASIIKIQMQLTKNNSLKNNIDFQKLVELASVNNLKTKSVDDSKYNLETIFATQLVDRIDILKIQNTDIRNLIANMLTHFHKRYTLDQAITHINHIMLYEFEKQSDNSRSADKAFYAATEINRCGNYKISTILEYLDDVADNEIAIHTFVTTLPILAFHHCKTKSDIFQKIDDIKNQFKMYYNLSDASLNTYNPDDLIHQIKKYARQAERNELIQKELHKVYKLVSPADVIFLNDFNVDKSDKIKFISTKLSSCISDQKSIFVRTCNMSIARLAQVNPDQFRNMEEYYHLLFLESLAISHLKTDFMLFQSKPSELVYLIQNILDMVDYKHINLGILRQKNDFQIDKDHIVQKLLQYIAETERVLLFHVSSNADTKLKIERIGALTMSIFFAANRHEMDQIIYNAIHNNGAGIDITVLPIYAVLNNQSESKSCFGFSN